MRRIDLDSFLHYQFQKDGDTIKLVQYGDQCPMYNENPGDSTLIATFSKDELVEFVFSSCPVRIDDLLVTEKIKCGDDLAYMLDTRRAL